MRPPKSMLAFFILLIGFLFLLLAEKLLMQIPELDRESEIIVAVRGNNIEYIRTYLSAGEDVNARTTGKWANGSTLLHHAADSGSLEAAELLIRSGAEVDARNIYQRATPLHRAAIK